jgi:hypothetical protein
MKLPMLKNRQLFSILKGLYFVFIIIILIGFSSNSVKGSDGFFPNEGDYLNYKLTRKRLPDLITSTEFTVTFHKFPFTVQLDNDESVTITENEAYPAIFQAEFLAENWTLFFPEVNHDPTIYSWMIVTNTSDYRGYTGSSVYPVVHPFEEEAWFPFLLNPQDIVESDLPKESHSGKIGDDILNFWIVENAGVESTIYVEEEYGLLLYVKQEVYDPIFLQHEYSFELLECKLGGLVINEPISKIELLNLDPDLEFEPVPKGIPIFTEFTIFGIASAIFILQWLRKN